MHVAKRNFSTVTHIASLVFNKRFAICALIAVALAGCKVDLYTKLSENEANEMVAVLMRNGIQAMRTSAKDGSSVVRVDEDSFSEAVTVLTENGLPRQKFATMGDVFADNKLVSSPIEERARFIYALSQELSKTLSEIDGVFAARVHLVLPRNDPLRVDEKPSSASVFIKHDSSISMMSLLPQIKTLVTNSIEGLTYDKVSVVFVPAEKARNKPVQEAAKVPYSTANNLSWVSKAPIFWVLIFNVIILAGLFAYFRFYNQGRNKIRSPIS